MSNINKEKIMAAKDLESLWNLEDDDDDASEGNQSAWNTEANWVKDAHLLSLDEIRKIGYPGDSKDDKNLGRTGLNSSPAGLSLIWSDVAASWDISVAKVQRITTCHGLCIWGKDPLFMDTLKSYKDCRRLARGMKDVAYMEDLTSSFLLYQYYTPSPKVGGSISFLKDRLGMMGQINNALGVSQSATWVELSITSIMTLESRELGKWKSTIQRENEKFKDFIELRKYSLDKWYDKHNS